MIFGLPVRGRAVLRRNEGRTILGGVLLDDVVPDGLDRIVEFDVILVPRAAWLPPRGEDDAPVTCGRTIDWIMVNCLGVDFDARGWKRDPEWLGAATALGSMF